MVQLIVLASMAHWNAILIVTVSQELIIVTRLLCVLIDQRVFLANAMKDLWVPDYLVLIKTNVLDKRIHVMINV